MRISSLLIPIFMKLNRGFLCSEDVHVVCNNNIIRAAPKMSLEAESLTFTRLTSTTLAFNWWSHYFAST